MAEAVFLGFVIVTIALGVGLMIVREIRAARADVQEGRRAVQLIRDEVNMVYYLLMAQESARIRRAARDARERLAAKQEGREDAQTRIDVALVVDESEADAIDRRAERAFDRDDDAPRVEGSR